jgi:hypothetical protein
MPMVLPLCVFGGLGYDLLGARRPQIVAPILVLTACCLIYALAISAASPFLPTRYRQEQMQATRMAALVQATPAPIYRTGDTALNVLPYVPGRILDTAPDDFAAISGPAWLVVPADQAEALLARRPEQLHSVMPLGERQQWRLLRLDQ